MNPWSKRPGKKVSVPRFSLESWAQHMADPAQYANMLREHARSMREHLKLLDKRTGENSLVLSHVAAINEKSPRFLWSFLSLC